MKKLYFFIAFIVIILSANAQHTTYDIGRWTLGGNIGGAYQKGDVSNKLFGFGYGATLEYRLYNKKYRFFGFSLRGRYLKSETFGLGYQPHESFISNYALNGFGNSGVDYSNQLFFQNNNTEFEELSLEAMLRWNKLYENTGILFYLFAGAGGTDYVVKTNQLDEFGNQYDYSSINYEGSKSDVRKQLSDLLDDSYETNLDNRNYSRVVFTPAVGVGLGFRIAPGVDFALEHKISLPQTDYFDGQATKNDAPFFIQDIYHYTSLGLHFSILKHHQGESTYTPTTTPTPTHTTTPTTTPYTQPIKPVIILSQPIATTFISPNCKVTIVAKITPDIKAQDVTFYHNNNLVATQNYSFTNNELKATVQLANGTNNFKIVAKKLAETTTKEFSLTCNEESTITICHKTPTGSRETINIKSSDWAMHEAHGDTKGACTENEKMITICHQVSSREGDVETIQIPESQWLIHKSHGDEMGACVPIAKSMITICLNNQSFEIEEAQWPSYQSQGARKGPCYTVKQITICHVPATGDKRQTLTIPESEWAIHQAHGDVLGACPAVEPTITICHKEASGNKVTMSIPEFRWVEHFNHGDSKGECPRIEIPMMTICHYPTGSRVPQTIQIPATEWAMHQAHGDSQGACPVVVDNDIQICHYNAATGKKQEMIIKESEWPSHQAHGDTKGLCPKDNLPNENPTLISICHKDILTGNTTTIQIPTTEWATHQAHGDFMGVCPKVKKITICHVPTTGDKRQTMEIPESEWAIHQAHGDVLGACPAVEPTLTICHKDVTGKKSTITIPEFRWVEHFNHGDTKGECPRVEIPMITICHKPVGGGTPQTIQIPATEWTTHQAHGDTQGACPIVIDNDIQICHYNTATGKKEQMIIKESQWTIHQAHGDTKGLCPKDENNSGTPDLIAICHKDPTTGAYQTIQVTASEVRIHLAHGDIAGPCTTQNNGGNTGGTGGSSGSEEKITICHYPPGNTSNPQTIEIPASAWPAHQAHGDTQGACAPTTGGNPGGSSGNLGDPRGGNSGGNEKITICHYPPGNTSNPQTIQIPASAWPAHQAHGDTQGACSPTTGGNPGGTPGGSGGNLGNPRGGNNKITICHYPPGNTGNPQTIEIPASAWPAHQAHGDSQGACAPTTGNGGSSNNSGGNNGGSGNSGGNKKITICHYPPGNTGNPQTIEIPTSAWSAHQAHGDTQGPCPSSSVKIKESTKKPGIKKSGIKKP
ncbi:MAG: porin family protein [Flavobacteriales bacterium]|nr:porin family protein [Flavobacteriales bacterium]MCW8913261.1 porin family protein [Flavobacteriales bacterium]MCW8938959.1 porin family protein [Flavobacteriales bacterium]MCW8939065.1 porin family protein [Flavobacteriales bacterium]MCW8968211.1 porin family protein [Flavobacteriales bacterium]